MKTQLIPSDINNWDGRRQAAYYTDELAWNLLLLKPNSKIPMFGGREAPPREKLLNHIDDGANLSVIPAGKHVILDLDSKSDGGESVRKFLEKHLRGQSVPGLCFQGPSGRRIAPITSKAK
jgi:hypothetical protein